MNNELEALVKLKDRADHDEYLFRQDTNKEKAIKFLEENNSYVSSIETALKEHEQYKAIEKELGIDIPTYFKIRKAEKVYTKDELGRIDEKYLRDNVDGLSVFSEGFANIPECDQTLYISGYGKDWALNKEDLEQ